MAIFDFLKKKKKKPELTLGEKTVRAPTLAEKESHTQAFPKKKKEDVIQLKKKESTGDFSGGIKDFPGIKEQLERQKEIDNTALRLLTSPKTTVTLAITLASLLTFGGAAVGTTGVTAGGGTGIRGALATRTAIRSLIARGFTKTTATRIVAGQATAGTAGTQQAALAARIFSSGGTTAASYARTAKSAATTGKWLVGVGVGAGAVGTAMTLLGTYPFAGFIKEEALQVTGLSIKTAMDRGDYEYAQLLLDQSNEIISMNTTSIPIANVLQNLNAYFESQGIANEGFQRGIDEALRDAGDAGEFESPFEKSARESEERSAQTTEDIEARDIRQEEGRKERDVEFDLKQEARDEAEAAKFEVINREREERQRQDTLFFEAIRKRNAGIELTEEEIALLESRGVSSKSTTGGGGGAGTRSALSFGLLR